MSTDNELDEMVEMAKRFNKIVEKSSKLGLLELVLTKHTGLWWMRGVDCLEVAAQARNIVSRVWPSVLKKRLADGIKNRMPVREFYSTARESCPYVILHSVTDEYDKDLYLASLGMVSELVQSINKARLDAYEDFKDECVKRSGINITESPLIKWNDTRFKISEVSPGWWTVSTNEGQPKIMETADGNFQIRVWNTYREAKVALDMEIGTGWENARRGQLSKGY